MAEAGRRVIWTSQGRSSATRARAEANRLVDVGTLQRLCGDADVILSICPPHAAEDVATRVRGAGFIGLFAECNADEINGNSIGKVVTWRDPDDVCSLASQILRLRFVMRDTKLDAFQFTAKGR